MTPPHRIMTRLLRAVTHLAIQPTLDCFARGVFMLSFCPLPDTLHL